MKNCDTQSQGSTQTEGWTRSDTQSFIYGFSFDIRPYNINEYYYQRESYVIYFQYLG